MINISDLACCFLYHNISISNKSCSQVPCTISKIVPFPRNALIIQSPRVESSETCHLNPINPRSPKLPLKNTFPRLQAPDSSDSTPWGRNVSSTLNQEALSHPWVPFPQPHTTRCLSQTARVIPIRSFDRYAAKHPYIASSAFFPYLILYRRELLN